MIKRKSNSNMMLLVCPMGIVRDYFDLTARLKNNQKENDAMLLSL